MLTWIFQGEEITDEMIPTKSVGFIYYIKHKESGRGYIGRKLLTKSKTRQKDKKIIKTRVDSDWRDYWSSSPELLGAVAVEGEDAFYREILVFCPNRSLMMYLEEKFQYSLGVIENDLWYNSNVRTKLFKRVIKDKMDYTKIVSIIDRLR